METVRIRETQPTDNVEVAIVIRKDFVDLEAPKIDTAHVDIALGHLFANYDVAKSAYFVPEYQGMIIACTGITQFGCRNNFDYAFEGNKKYLP